MTEQQLQDKIRDLEEQLQAERARCQQLEVQIATTSQWDTVQTVFQQELDALYVAAGPVTDGPANKKLLPDFSFQAASTSIHEVCPSTDSDNTITWQKTRYHQEQCTQYSQFSSPINYCKETR